MTLYIAPSFKISTFIRMSPDQSTSNQVDLIVIDGRHVSSVLDVSTFRDPNIDSVHYLVAAKFRLRMGASISTRSSAFRNVDVKKVAIVKDCRIRSVVHHLTSATLLDCGQTSPTPRVLLQKQSLVSSAYPNEINDTMISAARKTPQENVAISLFASHCRQLQREEKR